MQRTKFVRRKLNVSWDILLCIIHKISKRICLLPQLCIGKEDGSKFKLSVLMKLNVRAVKSTGNMKGIFITVY